MTEGHDRRKFLKFAASGTAATVAGCLGSDSDEEATDATPTDLGGTATDTTAQTTDEPETATVMAAVQPSKSKLQAMKKNITDRVRNGSINQTQAQIEFRRRRAELFDESAKNFESYIADSAMTLEDAKAESGAFLVSGPASAILTLLTANRVEALIPAADFESV